MYDLNFLLDASLINDIVGPVGPSSSPVAGVRVCWCAGAAAWPGWPLLLGWLGLVGWGACASARPLPLWSSGCVLRITILGSPQTRMCIYKYICFCLLSDDTLPLVR